MRKFSLSLFLVLILTIVSFGQKLTVINKIEITGSKDGEFFFPKMTPDGSKVFFTAAGYNGLWYYDLASGKITQFSQDSGAGYEFSFTEDGKSVIYRVNSYTENGVRTGQTLIQKDIVTGTAAVLDKAENLSSPRLNGSEVIYTNNDKLAVKSLSSQPRARALSSHAVAFIENQKIALYLNGTKKILAPLGEGNYIWPSVSPDGSKLLFRYAGLGTFVSDLNGKIIAEIGKANAPVWSYDGRWILYMDDKDDGYKNIASDIFASTADGRTKVQLTNTNDIIEMFPDWSKDGSKVVFHSEDGRIYLMNLRID